MRQKEQIRTKMIISKEVVVTHISQKMGKFDLVMFVVWTLFLHFPLVRHYELVLQLQHNLAIDIAIEF